MLRYHLDDLGWYQFESLMQSLLKIACGLGVESWGKSGDFGCDAYAEQSMNFPSKSMKKGPFIFQAKFVQNANSIDSKYVIPLAKSINAEIGRIKERQAKGEWKSPKCYTLVTNAPVSSKERENFRQLLSVALPKTQIVVWGSDDVCDLLDNQPSIRKSYPQLLSLRDLDELIDSALTREARERSLSAIESAREILPVFVPTSAYFKCLDILKNYFFAVLEGPPEVGKTSIAWVIAIVKLSEQWEAIACDKPEDFFSQYRMDTKQVFIADDAFGRTEYDPTLGKQWERQLDRVLRRVDSRHWLIWTSRKNILERAKRTMDLQGEASKFPRPANVLVDASNLTVREKAMMLYRHAQRAGLGVDAKEIIRIHASRIVRDGSFTPERVRRFIKDTLPELIDKNKIGGIFIQKLELEITRAIQTPTDRMRLSYSNLSEVHRKLLISILDSDNSYSELIKLFKERTKNNHPPQLFEEVLEELEESFVKVFRNRD